MPSKPTPGSITQTADVQKDRINNISNVSRAINEMQKDVDQKIAETDKKVTRKEEVQAIQGVMTQSVSKLNQTIGALTTGIAKITTDTARATAGAIGQYGKAISEDISFNKKSVVAMALAKTSPIYGYFVSKFMETNVWKQALTKMKSSIMQTMGAILRPFKGGAARGTQVPHAQMGGYVGQGGLAKIHAGETITPSGGGGGVGIGDLSELVSIQREQLGYMQKTFGYETKYYKSWFERMSPMRIVRAFRRTKGNYTAQLSSSTQPLTNIAHNIATLYVGLMWRMDNLLAIEKANAEANRDHATFVHKKVYPPIPGIRMRRLVKPLVRKLLGAAIKAAPLLAALGLGGMGAAGIAPIGAAAGVLGMGGLMLGKRKLIERDKRKRLEAEARGEEYKGGFLTKRRGVYKDFKAPKESIRAKFRRMFPTGDMLEQRGAGLGGTRGGPGRGALAFSASKKRELARMGYGIAIGFSKVFGGRLGLRRPLWVAPIPHKLQKKYYLWSKTHDKIQLRRLRQIRESNEDQLDLQRKSYRRAGKWRLMDWLTKGVSWIGGLFGGIISKITDFVSNILGGALSSSLVMAAIAAMVTAALGGLTLSKFLHKFFDDRSSEGRKKGQLQTQQLYDLAKESSKTAGMKGYKQQVTIKATQLRGNKISLDRALATIQNAQRDYAMNSPELYMNIPMDKIVAWREEWARQTRGRYTGAEDPYLYGLGREERFLEWVQKNKSNQLLDKAEIAQAVSNRDRMIEASSPGAIVRAKETAKIDAQHADLKFKQAEAQRAPSNRKDFIQRVITAHLMTKHGITDLSKANKYSKLIAKTIPANKLDEFLADQNKLRSHTDSVMRKYNKKISFLKEFGEPQADSKIFQEIGAKMYKPEQSTGLFSPKQHPAFIKDGQTGKINQSIISKKESEAMKKQADLIKDPIVEATNEVNQTIKDETGKSTGKIQATTINSSQQIVTSVQDSTTVSGGGGGGGGGPGGGMRLDPWYNRAVLSGGA